MRKYGIAVLFMLSTRVFAADPIFQGNYQCTGFDPYLNKKYTGTLSVRQQHAVYKIEMKYNTGEKLIGTGGQYNEEVMSVVFQDPKNLKKVGLEQYTFSSDKKTIQGYWVYLGKDKLGSEICEKTDTENKK